MSQRHEGRLVEVELVEDGDVTDQPSAAVLARPGVSWRRRAVHLGVACGLVGAAFLGLGLADAVSRHARAERLTHAPGGVLSLQHAPRTAWTASSDAYAGVFFLPGVVVQQRTDALVGLDSASGAARWRVPLPADSTRCGAVGMTGPEPDPVADRIVCVRSDGGDASAVIVLDASGQAARRDVAAPGGRIWPTDDGGIVTVRLVGPDPQPPEITQAADGSWTVGDVDEGYDALVHVEDAATGIRRWEYTVPFQPVRALDGPYRCLSYGADDDAPTFDPTSVQVDQSAGVIAVTGCGLDAVLTRAGAMLDESAFSDLERQASGGPQVVPYADGGLVATLEPQGTVAANAVRSVLYDDHGTPVQTFHQPLFAPLATDGTGTDVRLIGGDTTTLRAVGPDGAVRWSAATQVSSLLVRAAGLAVTSDVSGTVCGIDLSTGATRWTSSAVQRRVQDSPSPPQYFVQNAFTDGQTALLVVADPNPTQSQPTTLLALDVRTGKVRWRQQLDGASLQLHAVRGHLVAEAPTGVQTEHVDGGFSWRASGSEVRALR